MWPAIVGAAGSVAGSLVNAFSSSSAADKAFERQKELMSLQQQYAVENWNREVNYNDPKAQMQRLKNAGLNPNLVYGNGAAGLEAPPTAAPTAPAAPMQNTSPGNFGSAVSDAVQAAVGIFNAKKAKSETVAQDIENKYLLETLHDRIEAVSLSNGWTKQQTAKALEETTNLTQMYGLLVAQQNALSTDREIRQKELSQMDVRFQKEMRAFDDQHNLSHEEYRRLVNTYDDYVRMMKNNADKSEYDALLQKLVYESDSDFKNWERSAGLAGQFLKMLLNVVRLAK